MAEHIHRMVLQNMDKTWTGIVVGHKKSENLPCNNVFIRYNAPLHDCREYTYVGPPKFKKSGGTTRQQRVGLASLTG